LITGAQRAISPPIHARKASGEEPTGSINWVANFSRTAGYLMMGNILADLLCDRFRRASRRDQAIPGIGFHVDAGLLEVGTFGKYGKRWALETARILTAPALACASIAR